MSTTAPWILRKQDGRTFECAGQATLQRWIAEGRVSREDEISSDGRAWHRLGDSHVLAPHFASRDRAVAQAGGRMPAPTRPLAVSFAGAGPGAARWESLPPLADDDMPISGRRRAGVSSASRPTMRLDELRHDDEHAEAIVRRFRRQQQVRSAVAGTLGAVLLALSLAYSAALIGPESNPLRRFAEQHGLLPGVADAQDTAAEEAAAGRRLLARGDLVELERASDDFTLALTLLPNDGTIAADAALAATGQADVLLRWAASLRAAPSRPGAATEAAEKARAAEGLLARAAALIERAAINGGGALQVARARADLYRVQGDTGHLAAALSDARAAMDARGKDDGLTLQVLGFGAVPDEASAPAAALDEATALLERAVANDPGLTRGRIEQARIDLARHDPDAALRVLGKVLEQAPVQGEAQRVLEETTAARRTEPAAQAAGT